MQIDIAKLNEVFGLQVDLCRYCGGKCDVSIRERSLGAAYPYAECPSCKEVLKGYQGMFFIWNCAPAAPKQSAATKKSPTAQKSRKRGKK